MGLIQHILSYLGVALSLSFDGLGVGAVYSVKGTRIPPASIASISSATLVLMSISMKMGYLLRFWVSPSAAQFWGGIILVGLGMRQVWQSYLETLDRKPLGAEKGGPEGRETKVLLRVRSMGVIIQILKEPSAADADSSGVIDLKESVMLGIALGLDAFAAGFGASLTGFSWAIVPLVTLFCPALLLLGAYIGRVLRGSAALRKLYVAPGAILILIGLLKAAGRI